MNGASEDLSTYLKTEEGDTLCQSEQIHVDVQEQTIRGIIVDFSTIVQELHQLRKGMDRKDFGHRWVSDRIYQCERDVMELITKLTKHWIEESKQCPTNIPEFTTPEEISQAVFSSQDPAETAYWYYDSLVKGRGRLLGGGVGIKHSERDAYKWMFKILTQLPPAVTKCRHL